MNSSQALSHSRTIAGYLAPQASANSAKRSFAATSFDERLGQVPRQVGALGHLPAVATSARARPSGVRRYGEPFGRSHRDRRQPPYEKVM